MKHAVDAKANDDAIETVVGNIGNPWNVAKQEPIAKPHPKPDVTR